MTEIDNSLFKGVRDKEQPTRHEWRAAIARHNRQQNRHILDIPSEEFKALQQNDPTLETIVRAARGLPSRAGVGIFEKNGLIYRRWKPPRQDVESEIEQLVLPQAEKYESSRDSTGLAYSRMCKNIVEPAKRVQA